MILYGHNSLHPASNILRLPLSEMFVNIGYEGVMNYGPYELSLLYRDPLAVILAAVGGSGANQFVLSVLFENVRDPAACP